MAPLSRWRAAFTRRRLRPNSRPGGDPNRAGFALVTVIWSLGLISLLGTAVIVGARYRSRTTASVASLERTAAAAESAINIGIARAIAMANGQKLTFPLRCRMPGGELVTVSIEDEAGKVDLNTATPAILIRLFIALTRDQSAGNHIAERIVAFRAPSNSEISGQAADARSADHKPGPDRNARFATILQLDQIDGISPRILRTALPFLTVRSGRPEPDAGAASPALRNLLNLDQPGQAPNPSIAGSVTIRADAEAAHGARFIREALVSLGAENGKPFQIREWRRGDIDSTLDGPEAQESTDTPAKDCIRFGKSTGAKVHIG